MAKNRKLGLMAAAAASVAAGYYFYASKDAQKNRKIAAKWARDFKDDVIREAKKIGELDRASMMKVIDTAAAAYETARSIDRDDLKTAASELKANWQELKKEFIKKTPAKKTVKKSAKKAARKTTRTRA